MFKSINFLSGLTLLLALGGCRFGNYSEEPKALPNALDSGFKSIELFFAHTTQLETVALYKNDPETWNSNVALASIPTSILDTISNPVYLAISKDPNTAPMFVGKNQKNYIDTGFDSRGGIASESASEIVTLWKNPACQTQVQISQSGILDRAQPGTTVLDGSTVNVAGKLSMELTYIRVVSGDCEADLAEMAGCYANPSICTTDEWRAATNFFDLYIRQSGVLRLEDVIKIKGLAYIVHFQ